MELGDVIRSPVRLARNGRALRARLVHLSQDLGVTSTFVPRNQGEVDRVHAFRLLAHAEVQAHVDALARRILDVTLDQSTRASALTHAGHCLMTYQSLRPLNSARDASQARYPAFDAVATEREYRLAPSRLEQAISSHRKVIEGNNGIKSGNVRRLLVPLGYREALFVPSLMDKLDELGRERGEVAHQSGLGMRTVPTGSTEWSRLNIILPGLGLLEQYAPRLLRPAND
jgi:hypothetical protein